MGGFSHNSSIKTIENAETVLFKLIQTEIHFHLVKYSKNNLHLIRDEYRLLKSKLYFLDDSGNFRYPVLLPGDDEIVT